MLNFNDVENAMERFKQATDRAEQHQFVALAIHQVTLEGTYAKLKEKWDDEMAERMIMRINALCRSLGANFIECVVKEKDIVKVFSCHDLLAGPHCHEVSRVKADGVVSQPADFHHRYSDIQAVYRCDGKDYICIWEREATLHDVQTEDGD